MAAPSLLSFISVCFAFGHLLSLSSIDFAAVSASPKPNGSNPPQSSQGIPWSQIGAKAGADYKGDGLAVIATAEGARLRCAFQRLEGEATREGLWLTSTVTNPLKERFRVVAVAVGRVTPCAPTFGNETNGGQRTTRPPTTLPTTGTVEVAHKLVRFLRPGLTEEYTVSMDGVRQDFIIPKRPVGSGPLRVKLEVTGGTAEPLADSAQLVLEKSGRKINYNRLRVTDATGKELTARMEVVGNRESQRDSINQAKVASPRATLGEPNARDPHETTLAVLVDDIEAVYPMRIDPTFSDANWISMGGLPGADGGVHAAVVDGSGNLYIGGDFTIVGEVAATNIAKWNGSSWTALGSGIEGRVYALAVSGNDLYAGGEFGTAGGGSANYIAKWNGSGWSALGSGVNSPVFALAVSGTNVYAGGNFTTAGGRAANYIAKWDGTSWSALGSGMGGGSPVFLPVVAALAVSGSHLYAGGFFKTAGGASATNIAKWNGSSWSALGSGMNNTVYALAVSASDLYAGGYFTTAGGNPANRIAKWNGTGWSALGSGLDGGFLGVAPNVRALAMSGSDVYVVGIFTMAGGVAATNIAKWNGSNWVALGSGMGGFTTAPVVSALAVSGRDVYAGGSFTTAGNSAANYIAQWNGSGWSALGSGMNGDVSALAMLGSGVYAGGVFTTARGSAANSIAQWNGNSWSALGSGMGGPVPFVSALAVSGTNVYAGGSFTMAGGNPANRIAKWNGSSWSALGSGMGGVSAPRVNALAVSGDDVYAGGWFMTAGGVPANYIAKWNGSNWSALGSGLNNEVLALAVSASDVYAGGLFTAGGSPANRIAKWNGTSWSALGSGLDGGSLGAASVLALAVSGSDVYVGGIFTMAGSHEANSIAKWNGSSWSALGSGMGGDNHRPVVYALAVSGSDLYAGGRFTMAGGSPAKGIAKWNGSTWSPLGSGIIGGYLPYVNALTVWGSDLYVGGHFTAAGGKVSAYIARAYLPTLPTLSVLRSITDVMVSWPSVDTAGFALEQSGILAASASWVTNASSVTDDGTNKSVTLPRHEQRAVFPPPQAVTTEFDHR